MQLTVPTAQVILRDHPDLLQQWFGKRSWKSIGIKEMRKFLVKNKRANITMGAILFRTYLEMTNGEWARAVAGYNIGIGNALKRKNAPRVKYVRDVKHMQKVAVDFNRTVEAIEIAKREQYVESPVTVGYEETFTPPRDLDYVNLPLPTPAPTLEELIERR